MGAIVWIGKFLWLLATVPFEVLLGRRQKRYAAETYIAAPRNLVWSIVSADHQVYEGFVPIEIRQRRRAGTDDIYDATVTVGDMDLHLVSREVERRENELLVSEVLPDGTDPRLLIGRDYYTCLRLEDGPQGGTRMELIYDLTHTTLGGRFNLPLGIASALDRFKRTAEKRFGAPSAARVPRAAPVRDAIVTGAITLVSFWVLFDLSFAALLLAVLLLHELGHVLAMRWCGMPVRGVYFIPFMGAVAVGAGAFGTQARRGFVALMGPAASMLTSALFLYQAVQPGADKAWFDLALISILLNGFNLLPVLPLDGGQILGALLSRSHPRAQRIVQLALLVGAALFAWHVGAFVTLAFLLIVAAVLLTRPLSGLNLAPIDLNGGVWLTIGYIATLAFYVFALAMLTDAQRIAQIG